MRVSTNAHLRILLLIKYGYYAGIENLNYRYYLDVMRQYHLMGNGFISILATP
jgi:hypothetical protein